MPAVRCERHRRSRPGSRNAGSPEASHRASTAARCARVSLAGIHRPALRPCDRRRRATTSSNMRSIPMAMRRRFSPPRMTPIPGRPIFTRACPRRPTTKTSSSGCRTAIPITIAAGEIGFARMGNGEVVKARTKPSHPSPRGAVSMRELLPDLSWPEQIEIHAGKHLVRPRYEVSREKRPLAHRPSQCRAQRSEKRSEARAHSAISSARVTSCRRPSCRSNATPPRRCRRRCRRRRRICR